MKEAPEGFLLSQEDLENINEEELDELEETAEKYMDLISNFNEDLDDILKEINDSSVYEKLGVELHIDVNYQYSIGDRDDE